MPIVKSKIELFTKFIVKLLHPRNQQSKHQQVKEKTLIGLDNIEEVYIERGDVIMFPDEPKEIGKECFIILRKL